MSISRLLRAEHLAKRSARLEIHNTYNEAVRQANEGRRIVWAQLPVPERPIEPPAPTLPQPAEAKAEPPAAEQAAPQQPAAWHEEYCRWRTRTAADDAADADGHINDIDDPLGIYR